MSCVHLLKSSSSVFRPRILLFKLSYDVTSVCCYLKYIKCSIYVHVVGHDDDGAVAVMAVMAFMA